MNQVKFLGLVHTFATVSPNPLKKGTDTQVEIKDFIVVREVLRNNYQSRNLIGPYHFWGISLRNLTCFTRPFLAGRHGAGWAQDYTRICHDIPITQTFILRAYQATIDFMHYW